jgi:uncharacterized protein
VHAPRPTATKPQGPVSPEQSKGQRRPDEPRPQRIRDPLHNLIEFGTDQFEDVLWHVIQTRPFQRLRRIKQLGFSELIYPGATHTRFAHSVGVFYTARLLMRIIARHISRSGHQFKDHQCHVALAAALVHDLGHGMFSHAFEQVGKRLNLPMAKHESVSDQLIRSGEVADAFGKEMGSGFANDVADVLKRGRPSNFYDAVVSSQFDADRLDYMQRDRLMTGVQNSGIDFTWLMANLEIGRIPTGVDAETVGEIDTFVLGPKAYHAADTYVLGLFQLYPTVYLHKATRGVEKLFSALMLRLVSLVRDGNEGQIGIPATHGFVRFAREPTSLENALALDDTVLWGSLPMMGGAPDKQIRECALRLRDRRLPKCIDVLAELRSAMKLDKISDAEEREGLKKQIERLITSIKEQFEAWATANSDGVPRILTDRETRDPYKRFEESKGPLNQIHIRLDDKIHDVAHCSQVIAALKSFELFRAYVDESDGEARTAVEAIVHDELARFANG